jgi:glyoxylase-like metal-dependent hydrolase (beta-lactamase superfamily II)
VEAARASSARSSIIDQKLRGDVIVLSGAGGNIAVLPGRDGKLLIDAGYVGSRPRTGDALANTSSDPIKHLINTPWHFDHTDDNEWLHNAGAVIVAHENTRKHLSADTRVEAWDYTFPAAPTAAIPATVFREEHEIRINGMTVVLRHYSNAHTDSDVFVHFVDADIFQTGDTFSNGAYPFIDHSTGGSIDGQNTRSGNKPRQSDERNCRHSWTWASRRKTRSHGVPRCISRSARESDGAQEAGRSLSGQGFVSSSAFVGLV